MRKKNWLAEMLVIFNVIGAVLLLMSFILLVLLPKEVG